MFITEIKEITKTKYIIYIDCEVAFALYKGECKKYNIKVGEEISEEIYQVIMNDILLKRAKLRSMNLLKSRDYTEYQLSDKLKKGYYPQNIIDKAIEYVKEYGYVDDIRYAENFIKYAKENKSKKQIETLLIQKGISKENIRSAFENSSENYDDIQEEELIKKLLLKKNYNFSMSSVKEQQKIIAFLYRKGFSLDKIYKVVEQID